STASLSFFQKIGDPLLDVIRFEYRTARHKNVGPAATGFFNIFGVDTSVDFYQKLPLMFIPHVAEPLQALVGRFDKRLSPKPGIHAHQQDKIYVVQNRIEGMKRGRRIESNARRKP